MQSYILNASYIVFLHDNLTLIDFLNICCGKITVYSISQRTRDCSLPVEQDRMTAQPLFLPNKNTLELVTEINCQDVLSHKDKNAPILHMLL